MKIKPKYIYSYTSDLRVKITKMISVCGHPQIRIRLQKRGRFLWMISWDDIRLLDIELHEFWVVPIEGVAEQQRERPLRLSYQGGGELEVWYPEKFHLMDRVHQIFEEYYSAQKIHLKASKKLDEQLR